jgi:hypothetical protein
MNLLRRAATSIGHAWRHHDDEYHKEAVKQSIRDGEDALVEQRKLHRWQGEALNDIQGLLDSKPESDFLLERALFPHPQRGSRR